MGVLIAGLVLFLGIHLLPRAPALRARLINRIGERRYMAAFSVIALAALVLIVMGMMHAPYRPIYQPLSWARELAYLLMPLSLILLAAANMPTNIKRFTRHPMLWGVVLWSVAHLAANGDAASLWLFGSFAVYALADMALANAQGWPLQSRPQPLIRDMMVVGAGLAAFVLLVLGHGYLFGVSVLQL